MGYFRQRWEARRARKRADAPTIAAPALPEHDDIRAEAKAVQAQVRDAVTPGLLARKLAALIRDDGLDAFWTIEEIDRYIVALAKIENGSAFAARLSAAFAAGHIPPDAGPWDPAKIREAFGGQPGVSLGQTRYLAASQFAFLRQRLKSRYGADHRDRPYSGAKHPVTGADVVREKLWLYRVILPDETLFETCETINPVLIQAAPGPSPAASPPPARTRRTDDRTRAGSSGGLKPDSAVFAGGANHPAEHPAQMQRKRAA